jgi:xylulokinase
VTRYCLGIDIGTTAVKAILISQDGRIVGETSAAHDLYSDAAGWAEEDAGEWWQGLGAATRRLLLETGVDARSIAGVGVSGMVPAIVLLDGDGRVLRRTIQQQDARCVQELKLVKSLIDQDELYRRTGGYTNQQHILPRLMWVRHHEQAVFSKVSHVMGSYDYMNYMLTGNLVLEQNWAVESGLYDIHRLEWIPDYMAIGDIRGDWFPDVRRPVEPAGYVTKEASEFTGLAFGTPVVAGSADHIGSALAAGMSRHGDLLVKFGGGGDVLFCSDSLITHPRLFIDFHDIPGKFIVNGCMAASGSVVKWFAKQFAANPDDPDVYRALDEEAALVPPGSDGIIMLPYFLGEKTPLFDPLARGVFFGLMLHHTKAHMFRAILEAVCYGFRHHVDELRAAGLAPVRLFGTNGGSRSRLWTQIAADVLGMPLRVYAHHPGSALGAAFVAGMGTGVFSRWEEIEMFVGDGKVFEPDAAAHAIYDRAYSLYRDIYEHLKDDFRRAASLY